MDIPKLADRMRAGPTQALRTVFSGIGRLLMAADRQPAPAASMDGPAAQVRSAPQGQSAAQAHRGGRTQPGSRDRPDSRKPGGRTQPGNRTRQRPAGPQPSADARWRSLDETGNVRLLTPDDADLAKADLAKASRAAADLAEPAAATAELEESDLGELDRPLPAEPGPAEPEAALPSPPAAVATAELEEPEPAEVALPLAGYDGLSLPSIRARLRTLDADQLRVLVAYEATHAERTDVLGMLERRIDKLETGG